MAPKDPKDGRKSKVRTIREVGESADATNHREVVTLSNAVGHIETLAHYDAYAKLDNPESLRLFLISWWSRHYQRPLKDPVLLSYTIEELLYEFFNSKERSEAMKQQLEEQDDRIEEEQHQGALDWAEQEELKELEQLNAQSNREPYKPTAEDTEWINKQLQEAKERYGDDYGKDIDEDFE